MPAAVVEGAIAVTVVEIVPVGLAVAGLGLAHRHLEQTVLPILAAGVGVAEKIVVQEALAAVV
jgi:hypothetical protein